MTVDLAPVARRWHEQGWHPFALPAGAKFPPPLGVTGFDGVDLDMADISMMAWTGNIGVRMSIDVVGIDVDDYDGKPGAVTLDTLIAELGPLPPTVISSNGRPGRSGIRFYRVPVGLRWVTSLPGIDIIQRDHRYAVVWPSMHNEGRQYVLIDELSGEQLDDPPEVGDLPELPWPWIGYLSRARDGEERSASMAVDDDTLTAFLTRPDEAEAPNYMAVVVAHFNADVDAGRSRHDSMQHCLTWGAELARAGVVGALPMFQALAHEWIPRHRDNPRRAETFSDRRTTEFDAMCRHAIGKALAKTDPELAVIFDGVVGVRFDVPRAAPTINGDGPAVAAAPPNALNLFRFERTPDTAELMPMQWHAVDLLASPTHGEIAGAEKTFKSWTALAIAVGMAAGLPVLGRFDVPQRQRVTMLVGEGGRNPWLRRLFAVCSAYGIKPGDVSDLFTFTTATASVSSPRFAESVRQELESHGPALVILDPWYAYASSQADSSQMTEVGAALESFGSICREHGASALVGHHFNRKTEADGLRKITGAGHAEWVDSWLLLSKRAATHDGYHPMTLDVGSRQWGGQRYALDYHVDPLTQAIHWAVAEVDDAAPEATNPTTELILELLRIGRAEAVPMTKTVWVGQVHKRERVASAAFDLAVVRGQIVVVDTEKRGNRMVDLYGVSLTWGGVNGEATE